MGCALPIARSMTGRLGETRDDHDRVWRPGRKSAEVGYGDASTAADRSALSQSYQAPTPSPVTAERDKAPVRPVDRPHIVETAVDAEIDVGQEVRFSDDYNVGSRDRQFGRPDFR